MYSAPCKSSTPFFSAGFHSDGFKSTVYSHFKGRYTLEWPTTILAIISAVCIAPIFAFYYYGPTIRKNSKFAQTLASDRKAKGARTGTVGEKANANEMEK